jgi:hypothetical protein
LTPPRPRDWLFDAAHRCFLTAWRCGDDAPNTAAAFQLLALRMIELALDPRRDVEPA